MLIEEITVAGRSVLEENRSLIERLALTRKHFENWFLLEVFRRLCQTTRTVELDIQKRFPTAPTAQRCDLWAREQSGRESWVELKVCGTNYGAASPRAVTQLISMVIEDTKKLRSLTPDGTERHVFFVAYPLPVAYASFAPWNNHLARIGVNTKVAEVFSMPLVVTERDYHLVAYRIDL
jgi:hypothetical protein